MTDDELRTSMPSVFAVGDIVSGHQPLTPVAIRNGRALVRSIAKHTGSRGDNVALGSTRVVGLRGVRNAATTVFTPAEYGCIGLSEDQAIAELGEERVETFLWQWTSLEEQAATYAPNPHAAMPVWKRRKPVKGVAVQRRVSASPVESEGLQQLDTSTSDADHGPTCFAKLVCDKAENGRVVGFHFVGPNAGEVTQGFALVRQKAFPLNCVQKHPSFLALT